jgi:hypothetical protein
MFQCPARVFLVIIALLKRLSGGIVLPSESYSHAKCLVFQGSVTWDECLLGTHPSSHVPSHVRTEHRIRI